MGVHVALLRGVNVGGSNRVAMADLRALASTLGLANPRTLLQSGNLIFDSDDPAATLEDRLGAALAANLGLTVDVTIRTWDEWREIIVANPLVAEAASDPAHLLVMLLKTLPDPLAGERLLAATSGAEVARVVGRTAFIHYPNGIAASRLTTAVIDRALGVRGTARNWNTVRKIGEMLAAS